MKKLSSVLVFVLIITSLFSIYGNAAGETKTERFFAEIKEKQAVTLFQPMKNEDMNGFSYEKASMRIIENENGEKVSELSNFAKIGFVNFEMYATPKGIFMYFPQINRHIDFSFMLDYQIEDIFLFDENDLMPTPSYSEHMILESSVAETDVEGYGDLYTETFTYDIEAVVNDLVSKKIIPDPAHYDISLNDNKALSEFYWNYAGDYSGFASSLLYSNKATFTFNEKGMLVAADYFTGEGKDVDTVYYELGDIGGISAGASQEDFQLPDSSVKLKAVTFILKLIMKISSY